MPNIEDMEQDDIAVFREINDLREQFVITLQSKLDQLSFRYDIEHEGAIRQCLVDILWDLGVPDADNIETCVEQARLAYQEALQDDYDEQRAEHRREMREMDL